MAKKIKVLISNSKVNSYGFRVMTEGINIEQYKRNPILLWMHTRPTSGLRSEVLPLGHVEEIEVKDGALFGVPVIEPIDEFSQSIQKQWENGTLKMVSPRFDDCEFSSEQQYLLPGQTGATVMRCKLTEVSIVDIGANDDAMQLYQNGKALTLSGAGQCDIPQIGSNKTNSNKSMNELQLIALALGLDAKATCQECVDSAKVLLSLKAKNESLQKEIDSIRLSAITEMVDQAIKEKRLKSDQKDHFVKLGQKDGIDSLKITLAAMNPAVDVKPSDVLGKGVSLGGKTEYKKLSEVPENELKSMRSDDPATYKKLYKAEYGLECEI